MRRTRIKGIASIPQRKKEVTAVSQANDSEKTLVKVETKQESSVKHEKNEEEPSGNDETNQSVIKESDIESQAKNHVCVLSNIVLSPKKEPCFDTKLRDAQSLAKTEITEFTLDGIKALNSFRNEIDLPPSSPNKINRGRIKAIPRLGIRKISFSASESEDESKKGNYRTRNDSQSSNVSLAPEPVVSEVTTKVKEFNTVIQRKCKRTEWTRKLAEARREFTRKYVSGKPAEHKKLTMIDLIFYNPTTNTLKKTSQKTDDIALKVDEEEEVDDPVEKNEDEPSENPVEVEENDILAPQIKIGPSGEIILDEKSLLIESKETKKNRATLESSKLVDGNSDQRPYGVYKRTKRSKDWSHAETVKFYRALSTVGTDFSLMCELFPTRTRRELKMKFKKEEKVNYTLVDKAMMQPCDFNFEILKNEFELDEMEREELKKQKKQKARLKKSKENKSSVKYFKVMENNESSSDESDETQRKIIQTRYGRKVRQKIQRVVSIDDDDGNDQLALQKKQKSDPESIIIQPGKNDDESFQILMVTDTENPNNLLEIGTIKAETIINLTETETT